MGVCDAAAKDAFSAQSQAQNFSRLLLRVVQRVHSVLNSSKLFNATGDAWRGVPPADSNEAPRKGGGSFEGEEHSLVDSARLVDHANLRLCFWQSVRECRELILKALVLITVVEQPGYQEFMDKTIEIIARLLDNRETLRKCSLSFAPMQWPPRGTAEAPCPPYAVDVAIDVLCGGGSYSRLPVLMEQTIKQTGESEIAVAISLPDEERSAVQNRIEEELLIMWALSNCSKDEATLSFCDGKVKYLVPYEFSITAIYDLQRCQIIEASILVGAGSYGLEVPPILNIGFRNVLCQAVGLLEARHRFTIERVKRYIRETWCAIVDEERCVNRGAEPGRLQALRRKAQVLEKQLTDLVVFQHAASDTALRAIEATTSASENKGHCESNSGFSSNDTLTQNIRLLEDTKEEEESGDVMVEDTVTVCSTVERRAKEQTPNVSKESQHRDIEPFGDDQCLTGPPDYFAELLKTGRWISGAVVLAVLRDQVLRAKNFSSVFPGGVFRCAEVGRKDAGDMDKNYFKALDIYLFQCFDFSCGGLLTPLLKLALESSSLASAVQGRDHLFSMLTAEGGPLLTQRSATAGAGQTAEWELSGSGAVLRILLDGSSSCWQTVVWPLTPIASLLSSSEHIERCSDVQESLLDALRTLLPFDISAVRNTLETDESWAFLRKFDARRLELSAWTRNVAACLGTLYLTSLAAYLSNPKLPNVYTPDLELQTGNLFVGDRSPQHGCRRLKWTYYKRYCVEIQFNIFDGTLRVSFSSLENDAGTSCWPSLEGVVIDAQIAAAVAAGSAGMSGVVRLLPYLKGMAFLQLCRQMLLARCWEEAPELHRAVSPLAAQPEPMHSTATQIEATVLPAASLGVDWRVLRKASHAEEPNDAGCRVTVVPPADGVELTRLLHFFKRHFHSMNGHTDQRLTLRLKLPVGDEAKVCLHLTLRNFYAIASAQLFVLRADADSVVACFPLPVPFTTVITTPNFDASEFKEKFQSYFDQVNTAISALHSQLLHVVTLAALPTHKFPLRLCGILKQENHDSEERSFVFSCVPTTEPHGVVLQRNLGWTPDLLAHHPVKEISPFCLEIKHTETPSGNAEVVVQLKAFKNGIRLPAFRAPTHKTLSDTFQFGDGASIELDNKPLFLPDNWVYYQRVTLRVLQQLERKNDGLSASYSSTAQTLSALGFFFQGCRELQRLEKLRKDVVISSALPTKVDVTWVPWALHMPVAHSILPQATTLSVAYLEVPTVNFVWELEPVFNTPDESNDTIVVKASSSGIVWKIRSILLAPVLQRSSTLLIALLERCCELSPWTLMRSVIALFEFHASFALLVAPNDPLWRHQFPRCFQAMPQTKIQPSSFLWARGEMCTLGTEEVVLTVVDPRHAAPSPVPRVVERLQLFFRMPGGDTGSLDGAVGATGAPLCVAFHARVTTSAGFQTALGVMARSLDDALARFQEAFSCGFQDSAGLHPSLWFLESAMPASLLPLRPLVTATLPSSRPLSDTSVHRAFLFPTRFLSSFLVPLLDAVIVWLNGVTAAASINVRSTVMRSGALLFSKVPHQPQDTAGNAEQRAGSRGVVSIGFVRWQHSTTDSTAPAADLAPLPLPSQNASLRLPTNRPDLNFETSLNLRSQDTPLTSHSPTHTLELLLLPSLSNVLKPSGLLRFRRRESPAGRDPLLTGTASAAVCNSTLAGTSAGVLSNALGSASWELVRSVVNTAARASLNDNARHRIVNASWSHWPREFNFLLLPLPTGLLTPQPDTDATFQSSESLSDFPSFFAFQKHLSNKWLQYTQEDYVSQHPTTPDGSHGFSSRLVMSTVFAYFDIYPDALVLRYESEDYDKDSDESSTVVVSSSPLGRKRQRTLSSGSNNDAVQLKRHCSQNVVAEPHAGDASESTLAHELGHPVSHKATMTSYNLEEKSLSDGSEPTLSAVSAAHEALLNDVAELLWISPLKPHVALRADKREVVLHFTSTLDLRTVPALTEWTVIAKYFRLFASQMACDDFALLVRFFQRSPSPIAVVGDLASLLEVSSATADAYLEHIQCAAQRIVKLESQTTTVAGDRQSQQPFLLPSTPFIQLSFCKAPANRQGPSPVLDIDVTVWSCLPFLSEYLNLLYEVSQRREPEAVAAATKCRDSLNAHYSVASFSFVLSVPLPTTDIRHVLVNYHHSLHAMLEQLSSYNPSALGHPIPQTNSNNTTPNALPLSLHRPLSKGLARLFSPAHSFAVLSALFKTLAETSSVARRGDVPSAAPPG